MALKTLSNGMFSFTMETEELKVGLRPSVNVPKNSTFLTKSAGMVGSNGALRTVPEEVLLDILDDPLVIKGDFPFPQIFITDHLIIICNKTSILEVQNGVLISKISSLTAADLWTLASSGGFVYFSNGKITIIRDLYGEYEITTDYPAANSICNFNGQILIGSPK